MPARFDLVQDPAIISDLLLARRGQSYFSRKLAELPDAELSASSARAGWTRARVVAHTGLHARVLAETLSDLSGRVPDGERVMIADRREWTAAVDFASTLPPRALRHLSDHAAVHLNVEWRDLPEPLWESRISAPDGESSPVAQSIWRRAVQVWVRAIDLGNGGRWSDLPPGFASRLLAGAAAEWTSDSAPFLVRGSGDSGAVVYEGAGTAQVLHGSPVALARWAAGRGSAGVTSDHGDRIPPAPRLRLLDAWDPA